MRYQIQHHLGKYAKLDDKAFAEVTIKELPKQLQGIAFQVNRQGNPDLIYPALRKMIASHCSTGPKVERLRGLLNTKWEY